ncbi:MAG: histidine kinase [Nocardioides sp.]
MTGIHALAAPLRRPASATMLATLVALTSIVCSAGAVALHRGVDAVAPQPADVVLATAFPAVAVLVIAHQPRNLVGWLLLTCASMGPYLLAGQYAARTWDDPTPLTDVAGWVSVWGFVSYFVLWALTPLHFPDGSLPSPRWRPVRRVLLGLLVALVAARMFAPVASDTTGRIQNPLGLRGWGVLNVVTLASALALVLVGGAAGVLAVVQRTRRATGGDRQRMLWLLLGVGWLVVANVLQLTLKGRSSDSDLWFVLGMLGLVVALGVGVIRHQLFDVGESLRRTIVAGVLVLLLGVAAVAVLGAAGAGGQPQRVGLAAVAVVALLGAAAHDQLQQVIDRVVVGHRQDTAGVLTSLRRRLDLATGPLDALGQLTQGVGDTLRLPYVRIEPLDRSVPPITSGVAAAPGADTASFAVSEGGERLGTLVVGRRSPSRLTRRERRTLDAVAGQVGTLLRQAALSAEIQGQREQLVTAREDERRRLRRDLHDGVGPSLAGIAMQLDGLAGRLAEHPDLAARAEAARDDLRRTVTSVRRMVDGLRPPALDDMGLDGALRQLVERYEGRVRLQCDVPPDLPAATEAAAYLIASEAVTNAMRHSGCATCRVELRTDAPWLVVTVTDDGRGIPETAPRGVGLTSMRDRAAEVGGLLEVTTNPHGTVVRTHLPLEVRA